MKLIRFLLCVCATTLTIMACNKDEEITKKMVKNHKEFVGTFAVTQSDQTVFTTEGKVLEYAITDTAKLVLTFYQAQFSPKMPICIDMIVQNIDYEESTSKITFSGTNIIPLAMGGEFPQYTITNLQGTITKEGVSLTMICGKNPVEYIGFIQ